MKGFRGTLVFAAMVAVVAGLAVWQLKKAPPADAEKPPGDVLFPQNRSGEIEELTFDGSSRKFKLKKDSGAWGIVEPFKDAADNAEVNKVISEIFGLRATVLDTGDGPIAWDKYGLIDPDETIKLKDNKAQTIELRVGRVRTYDKGFYLRRGDEPKLIVASTTMISIYNMAADSLRNKKMAIPGTKVLSIDVTSHLKDKVTRYALKNDGGNWAVVGHKEKVSAKLVTAMIDSLRDLKATSFEIDDKATASAADLKKLGLDKPVVEFKLLLENPEGADKEKVVRDIKFGREKDNDGAMFYSCDANIGIFITTTSQVEGFLKTPDTLRDPKGPFVFDVQKVAAIKFVSPDFKSGLVLRKEKSAWQIISKEKTDSKVNEPVIMDFLGNVNVLEALEFFKKGEKKLKADYGVELKDDAGQTLIKIEFGSPGKDAKSGVENYLIKSSLADELVSVRKPSIDKLVKPNLIQKASAPSTVTEVKKVEQQPHAN